MKKIILIIISLILYLPSKIYALDTSASSYILYDMDSGRTILGKNIHDSRLIASITKIMTSIIAIESNKLEDIVTVDDSIASAYGSGIYIQVGEKLTLKDLLYGLMLRSGNDAALMISNYLCGSEEEFVKKMNEKASSLGMKDTTFVNSSGLDEKGGNYSSSYDMALLTSYANNNPVYREIVKTKKYTLKTNYKTYIWHNKNKLLSLDYITGGKTGFTEKARRTLVSTASKDNINLVVVTLNDGNDWEDHKKLYEYAFNNYKSYKILDKNTYKVTKDNYYQGNLYIKKDVYLTLKEEETKKLINNIKLEKKRKYKNGDAVGENQIYLDDKLILTEKIYVKKENKYQPKISFWEKILNFFKQKN